MTDVLTMTWQDKDLKWWIWKDFVHKSNCSLHYKVKDLHVENVSLLQHLMMDHVTTSHGVLLERTNLLRGPLIGTYRMAGRGSPDSRVILVMLLILDYTLSGLSVAFFFPSEFGFCLYCFTN